jgi:hypothetical protein
MSQCGHFLRYIFHELTATVKEAIFLLYLSTANNKLYEAHNADNSTTLILSLSPFFKSRSLTDTELILHRDISLLI